MYSDRRSAAGPEPALPAKVELAELDALTTGKASAEALPAAPRPAEVLAQGTARDLRVRFVDATALPDAGPAAPAVAIRDAGLTAIDPSTHRRGATHWRCRAR